MSRLFPSTCLVCGRPFHPDRNPSLYCTNAHRQWAYRHARYTPAGAPVQTRRNSKPRKGSAAAGYVLTSNLAKPDDTTAFAKRFSRKLRGKQKPNKPRPRQAAARS